MFRGGRDAHRPSVAFATASYNFVDLGAKFSLVGKHSEMGFSFATTRSGILVTFLGSGTDLETCLRVLGLGLLPDAKCLELLLRLRPRPNP